MDNFMRFHTMCWAEANFFYRGETGNRCCVWRNFGGVQGWHASRPMLWPSPGQACQDRRSHSACHRQVNPQVSRFLQLQVLMRKCPKWWKLWLRLIKVDFLFLWNIPDMKMRYIPSQSAPAPAPFCTQILLSFPCSFAADRRFEIRSRHR